MGPVADSGSDREDEAPGDLELERGMSSGTERFDEEKSDALEIGVQGDNGVGVGVVRRSSGLVGTAGGTSTRPGSRNEKKL